MYDKSYCILYDLVNACLDLDSYFTSLYTVSERLNHATSPRDRELSN